MYFYRLTLEQTLDLSWPQFNMLLDKMPVVFKTFSPGLSGGSGPTDAGMQFMASVRA